MSLTTGWSDWSCSVRLTLATGDRPDLQAATAIVRVLMDEVARAASRFRTDSDVSRVNAAAGRLVPVAPLTRRLVAVALDAARETAGAVDPTVGAHLLDAGYTDDIALVRAASQRGADAPSAPASWSTVRVDDDLGLVGVPAGLRLDLGATAKAWTADEAARRVWTRVGRPVLVEIGGDLAVAGTTSRPWRIDVAEVAGGPSYRVDLTHGGVATSSVLGRCWTSDRGSEHHLIDPRTSRPVDGPLRTASVWAPTALAANTWSTAAIVWGVTALARLRDAGVDTRLVAHDGTVTTCGSWPRDQVVAA